VNQFRPGYKWGRGSGFLHFSTSLLSLTFSLEREALSSLLPVEAKSLINFKDNKPL